MWLALFFGVITFIINRKKRMGLTGIVLTLIAFALGGYNIPVGAVEPKPLSLGLDWLILAFLVSVLIFTTLEKLVWYQPRDANNASWEERKQTNV